MIDTFNAALPVRLNVRNTCTIDGEKYVVFDNGTSNNDCDIRCIRHAILSDYDERSLNDFGDKSLNDLTYL